MPYRSRRPRRRYRKKRGCTPTYGNMANKVWKDVKYLKSLINTEFKTNDISQGGVNIPSTGTVNTMNGLAQGDDIDDRSGRVVRWKSVQVSGVINLAASTATQSTVRMLLVIDKQPTGVLPTVVQILDLANMTAFRNLDNRKRFVILKDFRVTVNTDHPEKVFKFYKKLDMKTIYDASNAGDITDISSNSLHFVFLGDEATNVPTFPSLTFRSRFIDN